MRKHGNVKRFTNNLYLRNEDWTFFRCLPKTSSMLNLPIVFRLLGLLLCIPFFLYFSIKDQQQLAQWVLAAAGLQLLLILVYYVFRKRRVAKA